MTEEDRKKIQDAYDSFCQREYNGDAEEISDKGTIPICFTTYEFDKESKYTHEIQINFDLDSMCWKNYIDDELVLTQQTDVESLVDDLSYCSFDDIIRDCVMEGFRLEKDGYFDEYKKEFAV